MEAVRQTPGGGNVAQEFVPTSVEGGPHESDVLPTAPTADPYGARSFNMNPMLLEAIRMSDRFWDLPQYTRLGPPPFSPFSPFSPLPFSFASAPLLVASVPVLPVNARVLCTT